MCQRWAAIEAGGARPILAAEQMHHRLALPQRIVSGQRQEGVRCLRVEPDLGNALRHQALSYRGAHLRVIEIPLRERTTLADLATE
ncbi:hypothetical protein MnTg02_01844 [bacterium MnTg02]|nr:hypothetical protein MnTg02_01844 [bacterium MnTg02]